MKAAQSFVRAVTMKPSPIAVFDSGIGSYSIVNSIREAAPQQDILYFADRKSFPYGAKTPDELFNVVSQAIRFLETYNPSAIVVASNVPSVTIMPRLKLMCRTPLYGVLPPVQEAMQLSRTKAVGVLGVQSLVTHPSVRDYIATQTTTPDRVHPINASSLVEKVESGEFLFDKPATESAVRACIDRSMATHPAIDTFTLSSTHLPWLTPYFTRLYPQFQFVDPATAMVAALPLKNNGSGLVTGLATAGNSPTHSKENFDKMLAALGVRMNVEWVNVERRIAEQCAPNR
jgi:glutamate racemase